MWKATLKTSARQRRLVGGTESSSSLPTSLSSFSSSFPRQPSSRTLRIQAPPLMARNFDGGGRRFSSTRPSSGETPSSGPSSASERDGGNSSRSSDDGDEDDGARSRGRARGNWFVGLGWALLGLVVLDQVLQYRQEEEAQDRRSLLARMQYEADTENVADFDGTLPALFRCRVVLVEPSLDGTKMLMKGGGLRVGDVVEVLEADVGPNRAYHLCRLRRQLSGTASNSNVTKSMSPSIGWYPVEFLERVDR